MTKESPRLLRRLVLGVPLIGAAILRGLAALRRLRFRDSGAYWEARYAGGGTSGEGSCGEYAKYKASFLNEFVSKHRIATLIEFGCGDGNQLSLAKYPAYIGLDVARSAIRRCMERFPRDCTKSFFLYDPKCFEDRGGVFQADVVLSLDVVYHLVEEETFNRYLGHLFAAARRFVIIFSSDAETGPMHVSPHIRHRKFTKIVSDRFPQWTLMERVENPLPFPEGQTGELKAHFYVYQRQS